MKDWFVFGALAFPPLFKVAFISFLAWLVIRALLLRFPLDEWFWHPGIVDVCLLIIICGVVNQWLH